MIQIGFGIPYFDVCDYRYPDYAVPVAVRGNISFQVKNYDKFLSKLGLTESAFQAQIRNVINSATRKYVVNAPIAFSIPAIQIDRKIIEITNKSAEEIRAIAKNTYGIDVTFNITAIELDKYSDGYKTLSVLTRELTEEQAFAQQEIALDELEARKRIELNAIAGKNDIDLEDYRENLRIARDEKENNTKKKIKSLKLTIGVIVGAVLAVVIALLVVFVIK